MCSAIMTYRCAELPDVSRSVSQDFAQSITRVMTDALARRGPDGEGMATWPGVALGHRRLAIIDLSDAGRQPMLSEGR